MRKLIRAFIEMLVWIVIFIAVITITVVCFKTILFDYYDPRSGNQAFIYMMSIAGVLWSIRWVLKPEYKSEPSRYSVNSCSSCFQSYHNCICHEDDYVVETHITEEMFNEAIDKIPYYERDDEI
tara:strand:+ start:8389 stop:8760 length:372 start_codon:yes stop_codon:yes gene_type:complete